MPVTYTNRKGKPYILCQGTTKSGNPWYYFALEPKGEPLDEVPEGYEVRESVNGIVSLAKIRPQQILPEELAAVEAAVARHPKSGNYRVEARGDGIIIHERIGPDAEGLASLLGSAGPLLAGRIAELEASQNQAVRFQAVMRFVLDDEQKRIFHAERWHYSGMGDWAELPHRGPVARLARKLVPKLGTHAFFDLY